jgi:hypothetical protein|tara:strand:+ start:813 stop:1040 length:228 start_codon:yes stop_codon:yes gene_type:complete
MIERTDSEEDYEPKPEYLTCRCGDDFAKHEGYRHEAMSMELDEDAFYCSLECGTNNYYDVLVVRSLIDGDLGEGE